MGQTELLIGTYTTGRPGQGLWWCTLADGGHIEPVHCLALRDPSFLATHPRLPIAYAVEETPTESGVVVTLGIDRARRRTCVIDRHDTRGHLPCHLALSHGATRLWVANYGSGTVSVFRLGPEGDIEGQADVLRHEGRSSDQRRQGSPHPHGVAVHPKNSDVHVTDLGTDRIERYRIAADGRAVCQGGCPLPAGAGPRHLRFDPAGQYAFLSTELDNTLTMLAVAGDGSLRIEARSTTLPFDFSGRSATSEVALHPNGRFAYIGNRGHDSIAWFALDSRNDMTPARWVSCGGLHPRHFALSRAGDLLAVANLESDRLVTFRIDDGSGTPHSPIASTLAAPAFVCWLD